MRPQLSSNLIISLDIESTGLYHEISQPFITQIALVPALISERKIMEDKIFESLIKCPSMDTLKKDGNISSFVLNHKELNTIVNEASHKGRSIDEIRTHIDSYMEAIEMKFQRPIILTKSVAGLDRRLLGETFGESWLEKNFHYQMLDLSSNILLLRHLLFQRGIEKSFDELEKLLGVNQTSHTAAQDAQDAIVQYFNLLDMIHNLEPV